MQERLSRRRFIHLASLGAAAAGGCAYWTPPTLKEEPGGSQAAAPPAPYGRYDVGVQSYCFRKFTFQQAVEKVAGLGLHAIEPFPGHLPPHIQPQDLDAVRTLLDARQVKMNAYGVCSFGTNEAEARKIFDFCKKVGIGIISANPDPKGFGLLDKLVAEYDIRIAIHNHGPHDKRWGKLDQLYNGTKDHHAHIGVCLDTGHLARAGDDPVAAIRKLGPRIHALHIKDWNAQKHDVVVGKGELDLEALFVALKDTSFDGACNLEYELDADNPVPGIAASLEALRAVIAKVG